MGTLENYVTADEAAKLMNLKESMIRTLCRSGRLPGAVKMGVSWVIPRESALSYQPERRGPKPKTARREEDAALLAAALKKAKGEGEL